MTKIDPEQEPARLAARYAEMSDLELEKVGRNLAALTEWAHSALLGEIKKRGLAIELSVQSPVAPENKPTNDRLVILRRYRDMPRAFVEKSVLEDAGIDCVLQDDNVIRMDWLWSNAMGGIKLLVREQDAADAERILDVPEPPPEPDTGATP